MGRRGRQNLTEERFYFVTTTVVKFTDVFSYSQFCYILINNIKHYQKRYKFIVLGYIIMPSHFYWIVKTNPKFGSISDIMRDVKKFTAWKIFDFLEGEKNDDFESIFIREAEDIEDQKRKLWMRRFDDEFIRNDKMFWTKLKYIHNNPVKAGIVEKPEDYKYSSARNYIKDDYSVLRVDTDYAGIENE